MVPGREGEGHGAGGGGYGGMVGRREVWCHVSGGDTIGLRLQEKRKGKKESKKEWEGGEEGREEGGKVDRES